MIRADSGTVTRTGRALARSHPSRVIARGEPGCPTGRGEARGSRAIRRPSTEACSPSSSFLPLSCPRSRDRGLGRTTPGEGVRPSSGAPHGPHGRCGRDRHHTSSHTLERGRRPPAASCRSGAADRRLQLMVRSGPIVSERAHRSISARGAPRSAPRAPRAPRSPGSSMSPGSWNERRSRRNRSPGTDVPALSGSSIAGGATPIRRRVVRRRRPRWWRVRPHLR